MPGPLDGIRVVDQTMWQFGPVAGAWLGDLGADVIKIEERVGGDSGRGITRLLDYIDVQLPGGRNAYFECNNRNKKSITLDLKKTEAQEIAHKLIKTADVYVQNLRKGVAERLGMGYETLSKINPRLIYASGSGYGPKGPDSGKPAYDYAGLSRSGLMYIFGEPEHPPLAGTSGVCDQMGGITMAYGVLAALYNRERTGKGQRVDVSHLGATMGLIALAIGMEMMFHKTWPRQSRTKTGNPMWNHYKCKDGKWLSLVMLQSQRYWPTLCEFIGRPDMVNDPRFATAEARRTTGPEMVKILDETFAQKTRDEWVKLIDDSGKDFIYSLVNQIPDLANDVQVQANEYLVDFDHPVLGKVKMVNCPITFSETPAKIRKEAPMLGENTEEVLLEMGYTWEDIVALKDKEVI